MNSWEKGINFNAWFTLDSHVSCRAVVNCWSPSTGTSFSYIAQVSTLSGAPGIRTNTAQDHCSDKLKVFKANLISGKSSIYQHRGGYTIPNNVGKWIQYSQALPHEVFFSEKLMMLFFPPSHFPHSKSKVQIGDLLLKKKIFKPWPDDDLWVGCSYCVLECRV